MINNITSGRSIPIRLFVYDDFDTEDVTNNCIYVPIINNASYYTSDKLLGCHETIITDVCIMTDLLKLHNEDVNMVAIIKSTNSDYWFKIRNNWDVINDERKDVFIPLISILETIVDRRVISDTPIVLIHKSVLMGDLMIKMFNIIL